MAESIMGNNPFCNGKFHSGKFLAVWDSSQRMQVLVQKLSHLMEERGFNYKSLALAAGLGETSVRDIVVGRSKNPRTDTIDKLASVLGVRTSDIMGDTQSPQVPVLGSIGAGEAVHPIDDLPLTNGLKEHEYAEMNCDFVEAPPGGVQRDMVALRVVGDSMQPYLYEGDIVYYNQVIKVGFGDYIGKRVIVMLKDGRAFIKILRRGFDYNKYTLQSINTPTLIENVELLWVAKVAFIKPKD